MCTFVGHVEPVVQTARVGQRDREVRPALVGLDQHHQLAEHLAQVAAVDLVDDEDVAVVGVGFRLPAEAVEHAVLELEPAALPRSPTLDEVLVGVRLMELHHLHACVVPASEQRPRDPAGDERLADARRALEDDVLLADEGVEDGGQLRFRQEQ